MIAVIDYDTGNLCSVANALGRLGAEYRITASPDEIRGADRVLLPGVGEASSAMQKLRERSLVEVIRSLTQPVLGICIGVQLLCQSSEEGDTACIGIFDNRVRKFDTLFAEAGILLPDATGTAAPLSDAGSWSARQADVPADAAILRPAGRLKIPHMGWNSLSCTLEPHGNPNGRLFRDIPEDSYVYFVHSYYLKAARPSIVTASTDYCTRIHASIEQDNVFACQFHPEKSGSTGLSILKNFLSI